MNSFPVEELASEFATEDQQQPLFHFGMYTLDPANASLARQDCAIALTPKAFDLLHFLLRNAGKLVTKDQLFRQIWPDVIVTDAALTVIIREIRQALCDSTRNSEFIETVHKKGYRFIGRLGRSTAPLPEPASPTFVGRQHALQHLVSALTTTTNGHRQVVFISGRAGIGKTSLVEQFVASQPTNNLWIGKGHCIDHHGPIEPYLPIIEAVSRLIRQDEKTIPAILARYAPSWLLQFPSVFRATDNGGMLTSADPVNPMSMMREMADFLEALSQLRPLILCLDDLQWCDQSTTEFLSFISRRRHPVRLLILATVCPVASIMPEIALCQVKQNIIVSGLGSQLSLQPLSVMEVRQYLFARFQINDFPASFAPAIHHLSNGNPLFMVNILAALQDAGMLQQQENQWFLKIDQSSLAEFVPYSLKDMIVNQVERLSPDLKPILEAAAVAGQPNGPAIQFTLAEVASALALAPDMAEEPLDQLANVGHFIKKVGVVEYPDGSFSPEYEFTHGLYKTVVYNYSRLGMRVLRHKLIAKYLLRCYGNRSSEIANKLAVHSELGRDYIRASGYLCEAAIHASCLGGSHEGVSLLAKARALLAKVNPGVNRNRQELEILQLLAPALIAARGNAVPEIETVYLRALELCTAPEDRSARFPVLFGLRSYYLITGELAKARQLAEKLLDMAENSGDKGLSLEAHVGMASVSFYQGNMWESLSHALSGISLYDSADHAEHALVYGLDPGIFCYARAGQTAWALGQSDKALQLARRGSDYAELGSHPYSQVFARLNLALISLYRGEGKLALDSAARATQSALQHDFTFLIAWGYHLRAWAFALLGRRDCARKDIEKALRAPKPAARTTQSFLNLFLAESYLLLADWQQGLELLVTPVLVRAFEAERLRLLAEFHAMKGQAESSPAARLAEAQTAESLYRKALSVSTNQGTKAYCLRSVTGLARVLIMMKRNEEADSALREIIEHCKEGLDKADILRAERLLQSISERKPFVNGIAEDPLEFLQHSP